MTLLTDFRDVLKILTFCLKIARPKRMTCFRMLPKKHTVPGAKKCPPLYCQIWALEYVLALLSKVFFGIRSVLVLLFLCFSIPPSLRHRCLALRQKPRIVWFAVGIVVVTKLRKGGDVPQVHTFVWLADFQGENNHISSPFYNPEGLE